MKNHAGTGAIYGIGILGALVYFIQHASSFLDGLLGIILAFFGQRSWCIKFWKFLSCNTCIISLEILTVP